jgi:tRNA (cmo5U34)-methyltransferase
MMLQTPGYEAGKRRKLYHWYIILNSEWRDTIPQEAWESKETVEYYSRTVNLFVPKRNEMLSIISRLATRHVSENPKILDIGSGYGDVTADILKLKPHSYAYLMDISDEMNRLSQERFQKNPDIHIIKHNLHEDILGATSEREFDSVVSCLALHHIAFEKRVGLYRSIREILKPDGVFINSDLFKCESPVINQWEFDTWIEWITCRIRDQQGIETSFDEVKNTQLEISRRTDDKPGTIWDMQNDMREAGFHSVDCVWKYQNFAILVAVK